MRDIKYTIKFQYGTYSGERTVYLSEDDPRDPVDVMWAQMRRDGDLTLPMAYQSAKIINEQECD